MSFYTEVLQTDPRFRSPQACYDPALLFPPYRAAVDALIAEAAAAGHRLSYGETYRSPARQLYLYASGRSRPGPVLTRLAHVGVHGYGLACDLILHHPDGTYDPAGEHYAFLLALAGHHPLPWGALVSGIDWGSGTPHEEDWDHLQGVTIAQQPRLFAGTWYPGGGP